MFLALPQKPPPINLFLNPFSQNEISEYVRLTVLSLTLNMKDVSISQRTVIILFKAARFLSRKSEK